MPAAEVHVDAQLVRRLLAAQFPEWSGLAVTPLSSAGWDNTLFRVGSDLVARLPRRQLGADLVEKEHRYLPELAARLPLPVPVPVGRGVPGEGYPWPWSVCPWLPGEIAAVGPPADLEAAAVVLGRFLAAMHVPGPADGPRTEWRGVPLLRRDDVTRERIALLDDVIDVPAVTAAWEEALAAPPWPGPDVWLHGDLHPANILVDAGRISAVLDFGDLVVGDPATDLSVAWSMFPPGVRTALRDAAGADDATWARARGWALVLGLACLASSADNPVIAGIGRRAVSAASAGA